MNAADMDKSLEKNVPGYLTSNRYNLATPSVDLTSTSDELSRFPRPLLDFAATMTIFILIVGVLGNLLTIVALTRCPRVRNVAAAFIISLCAADFIFCIFVLPFSASTFIHGTWIHGPSLCVLVPFIRYGNVGVSLLSIGMITVNRYIMITHTNIYNRIYKKVWIAAMIIFCWAFSYGMQMPTLFAVWGAFGYDSNLGSCSIIKDKNGNSAKTFLFITGFLIPCIIIVGCYTRIFWVVHQSEKRLTDHASTMKKQDAANLGKKSKSREQREIKAKRNEWRITKMVLAIFLSFVICYLPLTIVKVADSDVKYPGFHVLGYLMLYLSSCINPIIYVIMNKQYRQAYKTVILWRPPMLHSLTPAATSSYGGVRGSNPRLLSEGGGGDHRLVNPKHLVMHSTAASLAAIPLGDLPNSSSPRSKKKVIISRDANSS